MPLIKELEDLMPFVADMDEKYQKWAARDLRRHIVFDEAVKTMSSKECMEFYIEAMRKRREDRERK